MSQDDTPERKTREQPEREDPWRGPGGYFRSEPNGYGESRDQNSAYRFDEAMMHEGFNAARESAGMGFGPGAVEQGYRILSEFMPNDFTDPRAGVGQAGIPGGGMMEMLATYGQLWREYVSLAARATQFSMQQMMPQGMPGAWSAYNSYNPYDVYGNAGITDGHPPPSGSAPEAQPFTAHQADSGQQGPFVWPPNETVESQEPAATLEVVIDCARPVRVKPCWQGDMPAEAVALQGPYPLDAGTSSPLEASIEFNAESKTLTLHLRVTDAHPDGDYSGVVFSRSGRDFGYVLISVFPAATNRPDS